MRPRTRCKRLILGLLTFGLLAGAALTANPAQAASGPGPFYAEPAWDQKIAPDTRFLVLTNWNSEAVLDKETGLVWERSPATTKHTWTDARFQCTARTTGNRMGWRLPSVHELASLAFPAQSNPALPPGNPFLTAQAAGYWTTTTHAQFPAGIVWGVFFETGGLSGFNKTLTLRVWCVRGGQNNGDVY